MQATQTEPSETSLQQVRRSLNLENYFPHSSGDVVLRRKNSNAGHHPRPASQPLDRRPARSRLSATSTITESRRPLDSEFNVLPEQVPSLTSIPLESTRNDSSCGENCNKPQANCDQESIETNCSLYISEFSASTSSSSGIDDTSGDARQRPQKTINVNGMMWQQQKPCQASSTSAGNNNSKQFIPRHRNGN